MHLIKQLTDLINHKAQQSKTKLIAIDGRGGSGKSSLAGELQRTDPTLQVVHLDSFAATADENPFHPLSKGQAAKFIPTPWWIDQILNFKEVIIHPGKTVIVEGCYALSQELQRYYDLKIWVECPLHLAIDRALSRDGGEKDRKVWNDIYTVNESQYIADHKPQLVADLVIDARGKEFCIAK